MRSRLKKYIPALIGKRLQLLFFFAPKKALNKAFLLFCTPQKGRILADQEYFLEEAEDELIIFGTLQLQTYRWAGMGETILLIHGWDSNTYRWKAIIERLQEQDFNIIAFDAPAHGNSSGKTLNIPLYTDCIQKIVELYRPNHVMGHSVGAMATIFHQYTYPSPEIEKLIVLAPPTELSVIMKGYQNTLKLSDTFMKALDQYFYNEFSFYFDDFSMARFARSLDHQGLLIHDKQDTIAPYSGSESISKKWIGVTFITTEGFGHSLFFDEVDDMILNFLME